MSLREIITTKVIEAGGRLTVRSALNPILWLCGIVTVPCVVLIPFSSGLRSILVVLAVAPVTAAIFGFLFLLFFDRDKLQSEDYQIRKRSLELIEQKGDKAIPVANVELIVNPEFPLIASGKDRQSE
jgi:hypothetical protein